MDELSENRDVQVRFLLGPAGTGKTFRCLEEIRAELKRAPEGPPLLFLTPKQATFQIERQLLSDPDLPGYTRLQILSFDRLAEFVAEMLGSSATKILSEDGRVMVLRALLAERHSALRLFRSTARLPGFAQQLSALLRELQQQRLLPPALIDASQDERASAALRDKLHDVALLLGAYREWLGANHLHDAEEVLELAAEGLRNSQSKSSAEGRMQLWMDGFAEMTPQELHLLTAFVPLCERATLAFCLEDVPSKETGSWLSLWSVVAQTFRRCRNSFSGMPQCEVSVKVLKRDPARNRFSTSQVLGHIEQFWGAPAACSADSAAMGRRCPQRAAVDCVTTVPGSTAPPGALRTTSPYPAVSAVGSVRVVTCANLEAEAVFAAREILKFVREPDARFRDCAVLLRTLDDYHATVRRVFTRYGIPFFLDRRESIAHHPLAELTRFALRLAAFGWRREDWFGVLKTGLVHRDDDELDQLENEALARGWDGAQWTRPLSGRDGSLHRLESLRRSLTPAFEKLCCVLTDRMNGPQLAAALRALWVDLGIETTLQRWTEDTKRIDPALPPLHETARAQMDLWLENIERAFQSNSLALKDWLPILEAGLAGLTVGIIPPTLDQVLVGAIDRSRNPDLRLVFVLGMNEAVFPAPPPRAPLFTEAERTMLSAVLEGRKHSLRVGARERIAHERFYGYIACTRSRECLVLTCAAADSSGAVLNPSPFLAHLERIVPGVFPADVAQREHFSAPQWFEAEHPCEIAAAMIDGRHPELASLADIPALASVLVRATQFRSAVLRGNHSNDAGLTLSPPVVEQLYSQPFTTSVSALEDFAACPFKFFLKHGLRIREREEFEVDHRQKGIFQHEVLSEFHHRATANGKRWRDWSPENAAAVVREIGNTLLQKHHDGVFQTGGARRFAGQVLLENLERLVSILVKWMAHYSFDPRAVELAFGLDDSPLPGWRLPLNDGRELVLCGRIDRIDVCEQNGAPALGVVLDYKSSGKKLDAVKLYNGLELQLLSYLGFLRQLGATRHMPKVVPAGVFYVGLRGSLGTARSRAEAFDDPEATARRAFRHEGRFDGAWQTQLDAVDCQEQFSSHSTVKLSPEAFAQLIVDVEAHLKRFGSEILEGRISIEPYRRDERDVACLRCDYRSICRFDPWLQPYRALRPLPRRKKDEPTKVKA